MVSMLHSHKLQLIRPLIAVLLVISLIGLPFANGASVGHVTEAAPSFQVPPPPPGQLTRRTLSGTVVAKGGSSISVGTKFGNVLVNVNGDTVVDVRGEKDVGMDGINVGDKVVIHLNRPPLERVEAPPPVPPVGTSTPVAPPPAPPVGTSTPVAPPPPVGTSTPVAPPPPVGTSTPVAPPPPVGTSTPVAPPPPVGTSTPVAPPAATSTPSVTPTPPPLPSELPSFREVTALRIKVIPAKATRSHKRAVVTCASKGKLNLIGDDGEVEEVDDESGDAGDDSGGATSSRAIISLDLVETALADRGTFGISGLGGFAFTGAVLQATSSATTTDDTVDEPADCPGGGEDRILLMLSEGTSTDKAVIRASLSSAKIDERLARLSAKLEAAGKTDQLARLVFRADEQKAKVDERLQRSLERADARFAKEIERAQEKRKSEDEDSSRGGSGQGGGGGSSGGGQGGGSSGGGQGSGSSGGGGGSGSSGGSGGLGNSGGSGGGGGGGGGRGRGG